MYNGNMKRLLKYLGLIITTIVFLMPRSVYASTQDFYFEDFTADYYLTKVGDGTSKLHVKEVLTAVFPDSDQNHGITRTIPFLNQDGKNTVVESKEALNLTVLRNGASEPINKIEKENDYYIVYIGSASSYVHGKQVYTLEYDFTDVITEFDANGNNVSGRKEVEKAFQELYWDTNGTAWYQRFDNLTANLHLPDEVLIRTDKKAYCYVGGYNELGQDRCEIVSTEDGFSFKTSGLKRGENLTFVTSFEPGTFEVINQEKFLLVIILFMEIVLGALLIVGRISKYNKKAGDKNTLYKSTFVAPQYQPLKGLNVAEAEQLYFKKTEKSYVATLLELAVAKKISVAKDEESKRKKKWAITIEAEPSEFTKPQMDMLKILKGGGAIKKGESFPIEKHRATKSLADLAENYRKSARTNLGNAGYLETIKNYTQSAITKASTGNIVASVITKIIVYSLIIMGAFFVFQDYLSINYNDNYVGGIGALIMIVVVFVVVISISTYYKMKTDHYSRVTEEGVKTARYLEGLELYINMAEEERIKFLQSVDGADTSGKGIVKLYEKLLPWASLFGNEESWVKELAKYYDVENVEDGLDADFVHGMVASSIFRDVNSAVTSSTSYHESSGGGGSSWSSGGGGGGFSGGGGGGGGGGGW